MNMPQNLLSPCHLLILITHTYHTLTKLQTAIEVVDVELPRSCAVIPCAAKRSSINSNLPQVLQLSIPSLEGFGDKTPMDVKDWLKPLLPFNSINSLV